MIRRLIRSALDRHFINSALQRYVSPHVLDDMLKNPSPTLALKTTTLHCLLVSLRDDTAEQIVTYGEQAIPIYFRHDGTIMNLMGSIHFVGFGTHEHTKGNDFKNFRAASDELLTTFGNNIKIVAFSGHVLLGCIGDNTYLSYTVGVPKFGRFLKILGNMEFGQISEHSI